MAIRMTMQYKKNRNHWVMQFILFEPSRVRQKRRDTLNTFYISKNFNKAFLIVEVASTFLLTDWQPTAFD
jgi:hypothetical protein